MSKKNKSLSILIPCFNEIETIQKSIKQAESLKKLKKEIIIIDNGSKDGSQKIISKYKNKKNFKIILRSTNQGYGRSVKQALKIAKNNYLYIHFSDCEYDINTSFKMLEVAEKNNLDAVFGSRIKSFSFMKKILILKTKPAYLGTYIITFLYNVLYNKSFTDVIGSKMYKVRSVKKIKIRLNHFRFDFALKSNLMLSKFRVMEVFTKYTPREDSSKKTVKFYHIIPAVYEIIKNKFLIK